MVKFQFSYLQDGTEIIKSYSLIKLTRSKPIRIYLIKKTIVGGKGYWNDIWVEVIAD